MHNLNHNQKKNFVATIGFILLATILVVTAGIGIRLAAEIQFQSAYAVDWINPDQEPVTERSAKAPSVVTGENVYVAWWNGTAGEPDVQTDVMFRASSDGGATFTDKINLSNTTDADSWRVEIAAEGDNVIVTWWETNSSSGSTTNATGGVMTASTTTTTTNTTASTAAGETTTDEAATATTNQTGGGAGGIQDIPVMRVSNDGGATFGPMMMLGSNGTITSTEEEGEGGE